MSICKVIGKFYTDSNLPVTINAHENFTFENGTTYSNYISYNNGLITIKKPGMYKVDFNVTYAGTESANLQALLEVNGNYVPGARGVVTLTTSNNDTNYEALSFSTVLNILPGTPGEYVTISVDNIVASSYIVNNLVIYQIGA